MITTGNTPCDEGVLQSGKKTADCPGKAKPWVLATAILGSSIAFIDASIVNVALPILQKTFSATLADMQWVVNSYALVLAALVLTGGSAGDIFGRKKVFNTGIVVFALASLWCGLAANVDQLIVARAVQGIGAALLIPNSLAIISTTFSKGERGKAIGTWAGFSALTTAFGPMLGGWIVDAFDWRIIFFLNIPLALVALIISLWKVPESRNPRQNKIDWWGTFFATTGLGGLCYGLIKASELGFDNWQVLLSIIGGVFMLILFLSVEFKKSNPMVPPKLFRSPTFSGVNLLSWFLYFGFAGVLFFLPFNLVQVQGYSATMAGAAFLPITLTLGILSRWSGGLVKKFGAKTPLVVGPCIVAIGFGLLAFPGMGGSYWVNFFPGLFTIGIGMAVSVAPLTTTVMSAVSEDESGTASGINNAITRVAGMMAVAVLGVVAISIFGNQLEGLMNNMGILPNVQAEVLAQSSSLAATVAPAWVSSALQQQINAFVDQSFITSFRIVVLISAGLALIGAFFSRLMVDKGTIEN